MRWRYDPVLVSNSAYSKVSDQKAEVMAYQVVEPVHGPQHWHDPFIQLPDERNFSRIRLLVGSRIVHLANLRDGLHEFLIMGLGPLQHDGVVLFFLHSGDWCQCSSQGTALQLYRWRDIVIDRDMNKVLFGSPETELDYLEKQKSRDVNLVSYTSSPCFTVG
jgi:hypothetical protein